MATLFLIAGMALPTSQSGAIEPAETDLALTPAILEEVVAPGARLETAVVVSNRAMAPLAVRAVVRAQAGDQRNPVPANPGYDASKWITPQEPTFVLGPGEQRSKTISILAPPEATPGGHYAAVFFEPVKRPTDPAGGGALVSGGVGVRILVTVPGAIVENITVEGPVKLPFISIGSKVNAKLLIRNAGNVHLLPDGHLNVTDRRGRSVRQVQLPPQLVLPETERTMNIDLGSMPAGFNSVVGVVTYGANGRLLIAPGRVLVVPVSAVIGISTLCILLMAFMSRQLIKRSRAKRNAYNPRHEAPGRE